MSKTDLELTAVRLPAFALWSFGGRKQNPEGMMLRQAQHEREIADHPERAMRVEGRPERTPEN